MMLGATVIVLLLRLPHSPWVVLVGGGVAVGASVGLAALVPLIMAASPTRLSVGVTVVVAVAAVATAVVLVARGTSSVVLGIVVVAAGAVVHRVVVLIVERTVDTGPVALVSGAVGAVAYAVTASLAVVSGTTASLPITLVIGVLVGVGEGAFAGRLLRRELVAT